MALSGQDLEVLGASPAVASGLSSVDILGVGVTDATKREAVVLLQQWVDASDGRPRSVFIVNAHTLNLACEDPIFRALLNRGDVVFGDGSGVRLAAGLKGVRLKDNLVGTDLVPLFMRTSLGRGYRYYLFGGSPGTAAFAGERLGVSLPGIRIVGSHHGYLNARDSLSVVERINRSRADVLLVGMGDPLQERWIEAHLAALRVPVSIGVGGLFDHWAGKLRRAPLWVRRLGVEWMQILAQQPHKWRRYIIGNPKFVFRVLVDAWHRPAPTT